MEDSEDAPDETRPDDTPSRVKKAQPSATVASAKRTRQQYDFENWPHQQAFWYSTSLLRVLPIEMKDGILPMTSGCCLGVLRQCYRRHTRDLAGKQVKLPGLWKWNNIENQTHWETYKTACWVIPYCLLCRKRIREQEWVLSCLSCHGPSCHMDCLTPEQRLQVDANQAKNVFLEYNVGACLKIAYKLEHAQDPVWEDSDSRRIRPAVVNFT